jgi:quercetin dioxygenase-like cupin family protein
MVKSDMKTIRLQDIKKEKMTMEGAEKVFKQVTISKNDGTPSFCFRVFTIEPSGHTPYHTHDFEHLNYVINGQGVLVDDRGEKHQLKAGEFALILPNEKHQFRNSSDTDSFVVICAVPNEYE